METKSLALIIALALAGTVGLAQAEVVKVMDAGGDAQAPSHGLGPGRARLLAVRGSQVSDAPAVRRHPPPYVELG